jgi:hypothetical protein
MNVKTQRIEKNAPRPERICSKAIGAWKGLLCKWSEKKAKINPTHRIAVILGEELH